MSLPLVLGVDVGGTNLRFGVFEGSSLLWHKRIQAGFGELCARLAPAEALEQLLSVISEGADEAFREFDAIRGIGLGFPGFIDPGSRRLLQSPNLPGLVDVDLVTPLRNRFGVTVNLINDGLAAAYGEFLLLPPPSGSLIYVGLGTGVGGGLVLEGMPYEGIHGVAMELGHLIVEPGGRLCGCGNRGCLEQYASSRGIARNFPDHEQQGFDAETLAELAGQGNHAAREAFESAARYLASAVAHVLKIVDVPDLVIGGGASQSWALMRPVFETELQAQLIPVLRGRIRVSLSRSEDRAGMLGAAAWSGMLQNRTTP